MNNENKRYQVFVSSTFTDLIEERAEVTQAIMELNHMPYGMEAFPAANETQWEWIKRAIKESDYYIVIIGGKYGSINKKTGLSYTEMEYRYAEEVGIPTIAFIVDNSIDLPKSKIETDSTKAEKLQEFKSYIENNKLRKSYTSKEDLKAKVIVSFIQLINQYPRNGWLRADSLKNYTSNEEVIRLMKENEELKKKIVQNSPYGLDIEYLAKERDKYKLEYRYSNDPMTPAKKAEVEVSWEELFQIIGSELYNRSILNFEGIESILNSFLERKDKVYDAIIPEECLTTILVQFESLGYIGRNKIGYWILSEKGKKYFLSLNSVKK